ncbi:MAG: hypothetical protein H3Z52_05965 [archaeon]|nr:hypothetical protein [archaeon]MCP8316076.1 hypothetical protein [archaeon]MCP8320469.1 hypothetical protein [archaeon]
MRLSREKLRKTRDEISKMKMPKIKFQRLTEEERHAIADALSFLIAWEMEESNVFLEEGYQDIAQEFRQKADAHHKLWEKITGTKE